MAQAEQEKAHHGRLGRLKDRRAVYLLPNMITCTSMFFGFLSIIWSMQGRFSEACLALLISALMDGLDGKVARLTHSASEFGVQFDSLADLVAFGLAPAILMWNWQLSELGRLGVAIAFIYDHIFGWPAPYEFFSLPVLFGTGGGIALCIGTGGLMYLKCKMDRRPYDEASISMDVSFAMLLFLICLTGLLLMLLHTTALMGLLLCIHLGLVLGLFVTFSTSKFAHIAYRYFALVRNAYEMRDSN